MLAATVPSRIVPPARQPERLAGPLGPLTTARSPQVELAPQLAAALERWARAHRRATLAEHEQGVLGLFRHLMGPALAGAAG